MIGVWGFECLGHDCGAVFAVGYGDEDAALLESIAEEGKCVHCGHDLKIMLAPPKDITKVESVPIKEFWNRMWGLGSKDERVWGCDRVRELLLGGRMTDVELVESETSRCIIRSITLESKDVLHFAVGFGEAVIYKITRGEGSCQAGS